MFDFTLKESADESKVQPLQEDMDTIRDAWSGRYRGDPSEITPDMASRFGSGQATFNDRLAVTNNELRKAREVTDSIDSDFFNRMRVDNRSIIARAKNSTLMFPVYVSQSCPVNAATIIAQMFNRVYTTYVQTVLSQNPVLDEDEANGMAFLKRFHSNLNESAELKKFVEQCGNLINMFYQPIDQLDAIMQESMHCEHVINERCKIEFQVIPTMDPLLIAEARRLSNVPLTGFNYLKEAPTETVTDITSSYKPISDADLREIAMDRCKFTDEQRRLIEMSIGDVRKRTEEEMRNNSLTDEDDIKALRDAIDEEIQHRLDERDLALNRLDKEMDTIKQEIKDGKHDQYSFDGIRYRRSDSSRKDSTRPAGRSIVDDAIPAPTILKEGDIKKINDMLPYTIRATFRLRTARGIDRNVEFIVAVKTNMHLIRVQDLCEDMRELVTGNIRNLQKVRYKTGEISWAEYMFNTKGLKADAMKGLNNNKRWLNTLKRMGEYSQQYGSFMKGPIEMLNGQIPIPNGSLVLTQPDITTITNETGIDLSQISNARRLAKSLFLLSICIIDASAGTMRVFFPDETDDWMIQSLASVDAETAKTDNSQLMRELNSIVNRR